MRRRLQLLHHSYSLHGDVRRSLNAAPYVRLKKPEEKTAEEGQFEATSAPKDPGGCDRPAAMGGHELLEMQAFLGFGLFDLDTGIPRTAATRSYSGSIV